MKNTYCETEKQDVSTGAILIDNRNGGKESVVVIPTYNEVLNLEALVSRVLRVGQFDVLIVDDNSPDGTGALAEELAQRFSERVTVVHRPGKQGLGPAYLAGFRHALELGYQFIFTMDADFSHDINRLPALREALVESDIVIGSRYVAGGGSVHWPLWRRLLSRCGSAYSRLILGLPIHDLTGGFKGFRRHVLAAMLPELDAIRSQGYAFQIEMTYRCASKGFVIVEIPIIFQNRYAGASKMHWHIIVEALWIVWALRLSHISARSHPVSPHQVRVTLAKGPILSIALLCLLVLVIFGARFGPQLARGTGLAKVMSDLRPTLSHDSHAHSVIVPTQEKATQPSAVVQIQGADLTPNVPFTFVGSKFLPDEMVDGVVENTKKQPAARLDLLKADPSGQLGMSSQTLLPTLNPGSYTLVVKGERSQRIGEATFHLHMIPPQVALSAYSAKASSAINFSGSGFLSDEAVSVYLGTAKGRALGMGRANPGGNVTSHFTLPQLHSGKYTLAFEGQRSQTPITVGITIQGLHPWVVLDTYVVQPHSRVQFVGNDFAANEDVFVYLNQQQGSPSQRLRADSSGRFAVLVTWSSDLQPGKQELIFVGQQSGATATTSFTATPSQ